MTRSLLTSSFLFILLQAKWELNIDKASVFIQDNRVLTLWVWTRNIEMMQRIAARPLRVGLQTFCGTEYMSSS